MPFLQTVRRLHKQFINVLDNINVPTGVLQSGISLLLDVLQVFINDIKRSIVNCRFLLSYDLKLF